MEPQHVFDRVIASLGFRNGAQLAKALGRGRASASHWRQVGFPKSINYDLLVLSAKLERPLPPEFYASTGIPGPPEQAEPDSTPSGA